MKNSLRCLLGLVFAASIAQAAAAQVTDKKTLTLEGAKKVLAAAMAEAKKSGGTGVIAIVDDGGNTIALERLDNTFAAGANISTGKARTAALFKKPTKLFEEIIAKGRTSMVALNDFTPLQGGVPIEVDGHIVGAIGVSGAASAQRDSEIAEVGAAALSSNSISTHSNGPVTYFDQARVASSFAQGAILYANPTVNYAVHTSRRNEAGLVEIHTRETDVIYVIDGHATFVTGGTIVDGKMTEPDQIRGRDIEGGETRHLNKGEVIIVPAGVPHWFKQVQPGFEYYVVKVS